MTYDIDGTAVYCETIGAGMPLIALHGWGVDHRLMSGCLEPAFASEGARLPYRRFYPDLPGMGRSPADPRINGSDAMLDLVASFADAVAPDGPFLLAGESYGGYLARALVRRMPERVAGLLLIAPAVSPRPAGGGRRDNVPERSVVFEDRDLLARMGGGNRKAFAEMGVRLTEDAWRRYSADVLPGIKAADRQYLSDVLGKKSALGADPDQDAPLFGKPSLFVAGRQDSVVGYRPLWSLLETYPRATYAVLDGAGHNLQTERVRAFEALVADWLERVEEERITEKRLLEGLA